MAAFLVLTQWMVLCPNLPRRPVDNRVRPRRYMVPADRGATHPGLPASRVNVHTLDFLGDSCSARPSLTSWTPSSISVPERQTPHTCHEGNSCYRIEASRKGFPDMTVKARNVPTSLDCRRQADKVR